MLAQVVIYPYLCKQLIYDTMATWKEMIYMAMDELKLTSSDDLYITEEHVKFLLSKYRGMLLQQQYKDIKKEVPESNFQTLCLDLEKTNAIDGVPCEGGTYLKTKEKIPTTLPVATAKVYLSDYYGGDITFISKERMRYVGYNKWLQNITYASLGPDNYLYLKSSNPQFLYLENLKLTGIFENPEDAAKYECERQDEDKCDPLDLKYPLEEALIPQVIQLVVKELTGVVYKPADSANDASDAMSSLATFIRNNVKSDLQKKLEE